MKRKRMSKVRFKIHENGTATLSGLHYQDLRSIFCNAEINIHDSLKREELAKNEDNINYYKYMYGLMRHIGDSVNRGIANTWPREPKVKLSKEERWKIVHAIKKDRILFDKIFHEMIAEARKRKNVQG